METKKLFEYLDSQFTVSHIMTGRDHVEFATEKNKNDSVFSYLPMDAGFEAFWSRQADSVKRIERADIISADTPISLLIGYFQKKEFFFVNEGNSIVGVVHYSDLKKHAVRALFYILVTDIELSFLELYRTKEAFISKSLGSEKIRKILQWIAADKKHSENVSLVEYLNLSDFLSIASEDSDFLKQCGLTKSKWNDFGSLVDLRHWVAHPVKGEMKGKDVRSFLFDNQNRILALRNMLKKALK